MDLLNWKLQLRKEKNHMTNEKQLKNGMLKETLLDNSNKQYFIELLRAELDFAQSFHRVDRLGYID